MIRDLRNQGRYLKDIAQELNCCTKTISRAIKRQGPPPERKVGVRKSKLDDYKPRVDQHLAKGIWNAEVIFSLLVAEGYQGGRTLLRTYIHPKRPLRQSQATTRFETEPGQQLQHDWGELMVEVGGVMEKVYFSVNTLGFSRRFFVWAAPCNDAAHTYESLVRSFEWFGGVTKDVLVDNQKAAVLAHAVKRRPVFNDGFLDLAQHYGFTPKACKPYRARTKGKVERMVRYVKENFFQRYRQFESYNHLNQQLEQWLRDVADQRIHGTVKECIADRFQREAPALQELPRSRFDTSYLETRQVPVDGYINVRGNRYSVPDHQIHKTVRIRIGLDQRLRVFDANDRPVATHLLTKGRNRWLRQEGHHTALFKEVHVETRDLSQYEELA